MPRSLLFKMFITIGLQVNTYYSVTLCDKIKFQTQIVLIKPALVNLGLLHPVYKQM